MAENIYMIELQPEALELLVGAGFIHNRKNFLRLTDNYSQCLTPEIQAQNKKITTVDQPAEYYRMRSLVEDLWKIYPKYRNGMTLSTAYKIWQVNALNVDDAERALQWLKQMQANHHEWRSGAVSGYALGIGRFIREKHWLSPVIPPKNMSPEKEPVDIMSKGWMPKKLGFMQGSKKKNNS